MTTVSAFNIPHRGHYVMLRYEYVEICGNVNVAAVLAVFETWTTARETEIQRATEKKYRQGETKVPSLWLYETAEMVNSWVPWISLPTVRRALTALVDKGFLSKRKTNDNHDNTQEYRLETQNVIKALKVFWAKPDLSDHSDQASDQTDHTPPDQSDRVHDQIDQVGDQIDQIYKDLDPINLDLKDQTNNQIKDPPLPPKNGGSVREVEILDVEVVSHQDPEMSQSDRQEPQNLSSSLSKSKTPVEINSSGAVDESINTADEFQQKIQLRTELNKLPIRNENGRGYNPGFIEAWRQWIKNAPAYKNKPCTAHHASASITSNMKTVEGLERLLAVAKSAIEQPTGVTGLPQGVEDMLNQMDQDRRSKKNQGK